ncbi:MAG: YkgJ family cysteine cluster protein [Acidimicrobiia bacterium]
MRIGVDGGEADAEPKPAGRFSIWLRDMKQGLESGSGMDVPCGSCNACCRSTQFIPIGPDETDVLAHIPPQALVPLLSLPPGHLVIGYDEHGHCAMLKDDRCTIYENRPRACRLYDCRIFTAAGIEVEEPEKVSIAQRARHWQFEHPTPLDRAEHDAVRAAARFLDSLRDVVPDAPAAKDCAELAVVAIRSHGAFLRRDTAATAATDDSDTAGTARPPP